MTKRFEYTDIDGKLKEAEAFITSEYTTTPAPNAPIKTLPSGLLHPSLIPPLPSLWKLGFDNILASASKRIDLIPIASFNSLKYIFTAYNTVEKKNKIFEINIVRENDQIKDTVFGKVGNTKVAINVLENSGNIEVWIQNNELFSIELKFAKLDFII